MEDQSFSSLLGKTIVDIKGAVGDESITFCTSDGSNYRMWHQQNCCEAVSVEDICGDFAELIGVPILRAEERTSGDMQEHQAKDDYAESFTWTFYELATIKGSVTIRWYGSSNGYYSESVSFAKVSS